MWLARRSGPAAAAARTRLHALPCLSLSRSYLTDTSIESLTISDRSKRVLRDQLGFEFLTRVQRDSLPEALAGRDVLAKGKTGNGKTLAFLLPSFENLLIAREANGGRSPHKIATLVLSPTRELAGQIAVEAQKLAAAHGLRTACLVGGTGMGSDLRHLTNPEPLDVLVATPGRLQAHLDANSGNIRQKLQSLRVLVLDEADRLLDMGFRQEIMKIIATLPKQRQTLLFSATLPASTEELKRVALRADYAFVDTIDEDDHQTNVQTVQEYVTCDLPSVFPVVESILTEHTQGPEYKILVFLPTARSAQFAAQLFIAAGFPNKVIMFSSDVSARGVDYPDVSLVLQRPFLKDLHDLPLVAKEVPQLLAGKSYRTTEALARKLKPGSELEKSAVQSYQAWLGFYNGNQKKLGLTKESLVELGELYSHVIGLDETPRIDAKILRKMGLFGVKGLDPATQADRLKFAPKSSASSGGSRGGRGRGSPSRDRDGERPERSEPRRDPRNFGESASTPAAERFNMSDLPPPKRSEREHRDRSTPHSYSRSRSDERRGGDFAERGDRPERSDERRGRWQQGENRGRREDRFEQRAERASSFSSDRRSRDEEDAPPSRERRGQGRDGDERPERRALSSPRDGDKFRRGGGGGGGRSHSASPARTTSHRRDRGEQRRRERSDRQDKRF
ncbi:hypothetical protein PybrP1_001099 [[Pythium] brassicae (nom. inval.)]|nr:hypothetical protein PybrP1_001099 [[Pythium] brassicae (nom. inval.)]